MDKNVKHGYQAWIWAIVINAIVFGAFQFFLIGSVSKADVESIPGTEIADVPGETENGPGGTFGQLTHLVDDTSAQNESTSAEEDAVTPDPETPEEAIEEDPGEETSWEVPEENNEVIMEPTVTGIDETVVVEQRWVHNEFYLDSGLLVSLAPRLNPDGTLRPQASVNGRPKAPTYEDVDETFNADDYFPPRMEPAFFSKADLPEEYRDMEFSIRVRVHVTARGRIDRDIEISRSSGLPDVDRYVVNKILNDVTFEPARHKDTGEPKTVWVTVPIFFE